MAGNSGFQFKQFYVQHDACAMKVGTDAIVFAAWLPIAEQTSGLDDASLTEATGVTIADFGCGSGVMSLMLAQRFTHATVTGVELDSAAAAQASCNVAVSPFAKRIAIVQQDVREFSQQNLQQFDWVVANPPYFIDSLSSPDALRDSARHIDSQGFTQWLQAMVASCKADGAVALVLPSDLLNNTVAIFAAIGWQLQQQLELHTKTNTASVAKGGEQGRRQCLVFRKGPQQFLREVWQLRDAQGHYHQDVIAALAPFYLKL